MGIKIRKLKLNYVDVTTTGTRSTTNSSDETKR